MTVIRPDPTNLEGFTDLDVRISPKLGTELADDIRESVEWTQKFIQMTLPDRLIVTQKQFASLVNFTTEMYATEERVFITPLNAMQVVIDREVDIVDSIEAVLKDVDEHNINDHVDYPTDEP
jgi:hypothetical protein